MPRWLGIMLVGIGLGAGGVLFLQANYGPQRLTAEQSEQLQSELNAANLDRQSLRTQSAEAIKQRDESQRIREQATKELEEARTRMQNSEQALALFQDLVPPDPRGTDVGVRAALFSRAPGKLSYQILLMKDSKGSEFKGTLRLIIQGVYRNGRSGSIEVDPSDVSLGRYQIAEGIATTPEGFTAQAVRIQVMDAANRQQAMRLYYVRG